MRVTKCKYVKRFFTELITVIMILIFLKVYYLTYLDIHLFNNKSRANQMFIKHGWNIFRIKKLLVQYEHVTSKNAVYNNGFQPKIMIQIKFVFSLILKHSLILKNEIV